GESHGPARIRDGSYAGSRQLASGTRKVSTSACWPRMHACDTPSVRTIHAWKGANEISRRPSVLRWNAGVSFIQLWKRRIARSYGEVSTTRSMGTALRSEERR